jgi:methyl-accepting chemotaxis protein
MIMTNKGQEDEFMKQYMDTCKEQIEKLAKDPELLNQTLKPFMQMSQQLMAGGMLEGAMPDMIPNLGGMDINKMIAQMKEMIDYIKGNYKELMKKDSSQIQELDESSKKLRGLVKKLIEKIESNS